MFFPDSVAEWIAMAQKPVAIAWIHAAAAVVLPLALYWVRSAEEDRAKRRQWRAIADALIASVASTGEIATRCWQAADYYGAVADLENAVLNGHLALPRHVLPSVEQVNPSMIQSITMLTSEIDLYITYEERARRRIAEFRKREARGVRFTERAARSAEFLARGSLVAERCGQLLELIKALYPEMSDRVDAALDGIMVADSDADVDGFEPI